MMDRELLALIDERVRAAVKRPQRVGTLMTRTGDITALVVEDGSTIAMPVLIAGGLTLAEGDRVLLMQFGSDWVVVGGLSLRFVNERFYDFIGAGETTTSASFVDAPGIPVLASRILTKHQPSTALLTDFDGTFFCTGGNTSVTWGVLLVDQNTAVSYGPTVVANFFMNPATTHSAVGRTARITGIPAGTYDARLQWKRGSGTGTVTMDFNDGYSFNIREANP